MKVFVKFDFTKVCSKLLEEKLKELDVKHKVLAFGEVEFLEKVPADKLASFSNHLQEYGIEMIEDQKSILVQKIKDLFLLQVKMISVSLQEQGALGFF